MKFADKVIVVTGAAAGIGATTSEHFMAEGGRVIGLDLNERGLQNMAAMESDQFTPIMCDLTFEESIGDACKKIGQQYGCIDVLVNNAGVCDFVGLEFTPADFDQHFHVNLRGAMLMIKHCAELMRASTSPVVINIASVAARIEWGNHFLYSCAKAGLEKFTRHLVRDLSWLRANCILPGVIDTTILDRLTSPEQKALLFAEMEASIPCGRHGSTVDVAKAVLFLASEDAAYINGASLVVDGGLMHSNTWLGM